jgi:hypothetical protein
MTQIELEENLADLFDNAITDSIDIDWLTIDGARSCVRALLADRELLDALARLT